MDISSSYEHIINNVSDFVAMLDADLRYVVVNNAYAEALGLKPEEVAGKTPLDFFSTELFSTLILPKAKQCLQGERVSYKSWFEYPGMERRYVDVALNPVRRQDGQISGYVYIGRDITATHEQFKTMEDLEMAVNNAMQGISRLDKNGIFVMMRDEYASILGWTATELIGQSWEVTVPVEDQDGARQAYQTMLREGRAEHECLALRRDGSLFHKQILLVQITDENGQHAGHYCFMRDVTARREAEIKLRENERRLQEIISATNVGTWEWNIEKHFVTLSQRWEEITGYALGELQKVSETWWWDWVYPDDRPESERRMQEHFDKKTEYYECTFRVQKKSGAIIWVLERGQVVEWTEDGKPVRMSGTLMDISASKASEEELKKLSKAVEASNAAVVITNREKIIEYINPGFENNYGYRREEIIGKHIDILRSREMAPELHSNMLSQLRAGRDWKGTLPHKRKNGDIQQDSVIISSVRNHLNEITHYISIHQDVTHEHELSKKLSFQATHDALTGLYNRREFENRARRMISQRRIKQTQHALCFLDLDQFKIVNDTCGHGAGDELLRQISAMLRQQTREGDMLARLGGDEFALLMENCSLENAQRVADKVLATLQEYQFSWSGHVFRIGASIGLVAIDDYIEDLSELMKHADVSCYAAKELGRNRYHVFNPSDETLSQRSGEMQWVTRIYSALEHNQFCLHAQRIDPIGRHDSESHYELLIRLQDASGQTYPPGSFLPAAERYNLISKIDRWVIKHAFMMLKERHDFLAGIHHISINISGPSLTDESFLIFVKEQLTQYPYLADKVCFEITETAAIANLTRAQQTITEFKSLGCAFALDDFGSGLSSFAYLKTLPVDYIKIDGMFVKDIAEDPIDHAMVRSINEVAQVMGMKTIAEFVEYDEIKGMLREIGVDYAQGYGVDKPKPLNEVLGNVADTTVVDIASWTKAQNI